MNIAALRNEYSLKSLDITHVAQHPMEQFRIWFEEALDSKVIEANAMTLSTVNKDHKPSARVLLLKGMDHGFVFFTNYNSRKGKEIEQNPFAAMTFFWPELERQVRIEGRLEKVSAEENDEYFYSRPLGSQIGALASPQSQHIPDRYFLEQRLAQVEEKAKNEAIQRPQHWGGYRLLPERVEFWQGRPSRLHDRLQFELAENDTWQIKRLAP